jgi:hypothetical protein
MLILLKNLNKYNYTIIYEIKYLRDPVFYQMKKLIEVFKTMTRYETRDNNMINEYVIKIQNNLIYKT